MTRTASRPIRVSKHVPNREHFRLKPQSFQVGSRSGTMKITDAKSFGKAIRDARHRLNATQKDVALASGTGLRFLIDLEKGKPTCRIGKALEIARVLGLHLEMSDR
jgi:HTH-type transcriptional regulator/antitoxin HipB